MIWHVAAPPTSADIEADLVGDGLRAVITFVSGTEVAGSCVP